MRKSERERKETCGSALLLVLSTTGGGLGRSQPESSCMVMCNTFEEFLSEDSIYDKLPRIVLVSACFELKVLYKHSSREIK